MKALIIFYSSDNSYVIEYHAAAAAAPSKYCVKQHGAMASIKYHR